jgi:hypothetical protein
MGDFVLPTKQRPGVFEKLPNSRQPCFVQLARKRSMPSMFCIEGILAQTHTPEESTTCEMFLFPVSRSTLYQNRVGATTPIQVIF